jgi:hypothetical protein
MEISRRDFLLGGRAVAPIVFTVDISYTLQCFILNDNGNKEQSNLVPVWIEIQILSFISQAK